MDFARELGMRRRLWMGLLVALGALALPGSAGAVTTCTFDDASDTVNIAMSQSADTAQARVEAGEIKVIGTGGNPCTGAGGPPTVTNTDTVNVSDNSSGGITTFGVIGPSDFAPGVTGEGVGASEIEFNVNLGSDTGDGFIAIGTGGADVWKMGMTGSATEIDFNADGDSELGIVTGIDQWSLLGEAGDDSISAQGGAGVGTPFSGPAPLRITGAADDDILEGGNGPAGDRIVGDVGNDTLRGFEANDTLDGSVGDDIFDGGAGDHDLADYGSAFTPLTVDLATALPQDTGQGVDTLLDVEDVLGSSGNDTLLGSAGPNRLVGDGFLVAGDDTLDGRGGDDELNGGGGTDTVTYAGAPAGVNVDLTAGQATGGFGSDTLGTVENLIGSPFADTLTGDPGANSLTGLAGNDTISALAGADTVDARDGGPDTASCGTEIDSATADQQSVDTVNADCENVAFLAEPGGGGGGQEGGGGGGQEGGGGGGQEGADDTTLEFELGGRRVQNLVDQRRIVVKGLCPAEDCTAKARAKVKLSRPKGERQKAARAKLTLKPVTRSLQAGVQTKIRLRLTRKQLGAVGRALDAATRVRATVSVNATDGAGNRTSAKRKVKAKG